VYLPWIPVLEAFANLLVVADLLTRHHEWAINLREDEIDQRLVDTFQKFWDAL